jgi:hypothetical protein
MKVRQKQQIKGEISRLNPLFKLEEQKPYSHQGLKKSFPRVNTIVQKIINTYFPTCPNQVILLTGKSFATLFSNDSIGS